MPDSITQSFVQRLVTEQGFRESAQQVFKQVESTAASDLLQRCRALNACFKQVCTNYSSRNMDGLYPRATAAVPTVATVCTPTNMVICRDSLPNQLQNQL